MICATAPSGIIARLTVLYFYCYSNRNGINCFKVEKHVFVVSPDDITCCLKMKLIRVDRKRSEGYDTRVHHAGCSLLGPSTELFNSNPSIFQRNTLIKA